MKENPERHRFRFTLRRMLLLIAILGLLLAVVSREVARYHRSRQVAQSIDKLGGFAHWNSKIIENLVRDKTLTRITEVYFPNPDFDADTWQQLAELPHQFGLHLKGQKVTDQTLTHLVHIKQLTYLVLRRSNVSEAGIVAWQRERPDVWVIVGLPGEPEFREYPSLTP